MFDMAVSEQAVPHFVPALDLLNTTPGVFIQRDFEAFNKLRVFFFDKIRRVFGCVLARFGHIVAEPPHDLQTHQVFALFVVLRRKGTALDLWIQIVALKVLDFQQPGLVIDTGDLPAAAIGIFAHIQPLEQPLRAALHRMAQPDGTDTGVPLHIAAEHRHRIGIVEEQSIRAKPLHDVGIGLHHGDGAQGTENAPDP